jgi:flavin-dependent dehydrogenase
MRVVLVERAHFPRFVIGESLLPRCRDLLGEIGALEAVEECGYFRKAGATFWRDGERSEFSFAEQFTSGSDHAWHVRRAEFDKCLADLAAKRGARIEYGCTVVGVETGKSPQLHCRRERGEDLSISARWIIDGSGYGRVLARLLQLDKPSNFPARRAVFAHVKSEKLVGIANSADTWAVALSPDAWAWVIPFAADTASVGLVGGSEFFSGLPADSGDALQESFSRFELLKNAVGESAEFVLAPRAIEAYAVGVEKLWGDGFTLVGNSAEFLDPIFSSGVTLAMESAYTCARLLIRQLGGEDVDWQSDYSDYVNRGVDTFRSYVLAWYSGVLAEIFFASVRQPSIKEQICSVLAGYAWDESNPFVREPERKIQQVLRLARAASDAAD